MKIYMLFIAFLVVGCKVKSDDVSKTCKAVLLEHCNCLQIYQPVCGCDGKTYSNSCHAECASITDYNEGECP